MGHCDARGEESHQPNADGEPGKEDNGSRGTQTPMDLRKYSHLHYTLSELCCQTLLLCLIPEIKLKFR